MDVANIFIEHFLIFFKNWFEPDFNTSLFTETTEAAVSYYLIKKKKQQQLLKTMRWRKIPASKMPMSQITLSSRFIHLCHDNVKAASYAAEVSLSSSTPALLNLILKARQLGCADAGASPHRGPEQPRM